MKTSVFAPGNGENILVKNGEGINIFFIGVGGAFSKEFNRTNFLIIKKDVPLYGLDRMRELDGLIDRNIAADMLVYRPDEFNERIRLGDPFIETILREGRVLYG